MTGEIIDRETWRRIGGPGPGDHLISPLGDSVGIVSAVIREGPRRGVVVMETSTGSGSVSWELDGGRSTYEYLIEFRGYRFFRPEPTPK
jgi:hypothetical protein